MSTLLLAPHADDESLFASYLAQRYSAHIAVVYDEGRKDELELATRWLGCTYTQGNLPKGASSDQVEALLIGLRDPSGADDWNLVIVPMDYGEGKGHEEHNLVGRLAEQTFHDVPLLGYRTYETRGQRDTRGPESFPAEPEHVARKLAALSCYRSQIVNPDTGPWFYSLLDMREWTA